MTNHNVDPTMQPTLESAHNLPEVASLAGNLALGGDIQSVTPETNLDRFDRIFAPVEIPDEDEADYDFKNLLDPNYDDSHLTVEDAAVRSPEGRLNVTDDTRRYSFEQLKGVMRQDRNVVRLIDKHLTADKERKVIDLSSIDKIRTNAALRKELGLYFIHKVDSMASIMPKRIQDNTEKKLSDSFVGYNIDFPVKSREYAALLAVSMLDGTFHPDKEDEIAYNPDGTVQLGQHREAAKRVLFSPEV